MRNRRLRGCGGGQLAWVARRAREGYYARRRPQYIMGGRGHAGADDRPGGDGFRRRDRGLNRPEPQAHGSTPSASPSEGFSITKGSTMTPDSVLNYLKQNPEFFDEHADFLATIFTPHPHGGRAISISERQVLTLREKGKQLEGKLRELIEFGEENDAISEKLHRLTLALVGARDAETVIEALYFHL